MDLRAAVLGKSVRRKVGSCRRGSSHMRASHRRPNRMSGLFMRRVWNQILCSRRNSKNLSLRVCLSDGSDLAG